MSHCVISDYLISKAEEWGGRKIHALPERKWMSFTDFFSKRNILSSSLIFVEWNHRRFEKKKRKKEMKLVSKVTNQRLVVSRQMQATFNFVLSDYFFFIQQRQEDSNFNHWIFKVPQNECFLLIFPFFSIFFGARGKCVRSSHAWLIITGHSNRISFDILTELKANFSKWPCRSDKKTGNGLTSY